MHEFNLFSELGWSDPLTNRNTPAVLHVELVPGDTVDVRLAAKGGGSENKSDSGRFAEDGR